MSEAFVPPYPTPHRSKLGRAARFVSGWRSWIHTLYEKSYTMKMGEIRLPRVDFFIPNETSLVAEVMDHPREYPKHHLMQEMLFPLIGNSVFSANGQDWEDQREMVNPSFQHTNLRRAFPNMNEAADALLSRMRRCDLSQPVHVDPLMTHVTADVIFRTILSRELNEAEATQVFEAFERYQRHIQPATILRIYGLPIGWLRRKLDNAAKEIHDVFAPLMQARYDAFHRGEPDTHEDILHSLLDARHPRTNEPFTFPQLLDQMGIIFLAGHETSASALTWALYLIASCPHLQEQMLAEVKGTDAIDADAIRRFDITRNIFKETMRLYPPVSFFMREVTKETSMRGKRMKKGSLLVISPWLLQRNKNNFPCPHAFMPERFADVSQQEACKNAYMPFGRGPRICIGAGFAQQEAVLMLARIIREFRVTVPEGMVPEPVSRLTTRPKDGVRLIFTPRG